MKKILWGPKRGEEISKGVTTFIKRKKEKASDVPTMKNNNSSSPRS